MKVEITKDDIVGTVEYLPKKKDFILDFEHKDKDKVEKFLNKRQEYKIPESNIIDDYRVDIELPTESEMYFTLALCTLHANTGVWVNWEKEE